MTLANMEALPVAEWAADDCVLLLWATDPLLERAFDIIHAWEDRKRSGNVDPRCPRRRGRRGPDLPRAGAQLSPSRSRDPHRGRFPG